MSDFESRLAKVEVELAAMRERAAYFNVIYEKFDKTLEKLETMIEERRNNTNDDLRDVYSKIEKVESSIMGEMEKIRQEMKAQHEVERRKIEDLNKWRWIVVGASGFIAWLISVLAKIKTA